MFIDKKMKTDTAIKKVIDSYYVPVELNYSPETRNEAAKPKAVPGNWNSKNYIIS